jgi:hypothetical protein
MTTMSSILLFLCCADHVCCIVVVLFRYAQGLANILKSVALESVHDLQVAGITNEAPDILA